MYVIIPASDMETALLPISEPVCKTLVPINGKPVLQYILDELYSYQSFIDEIVIVKRDAEDIREYLKYNKQDEFFLTKIHCVDGKNYKQMLNAKYSILDDFYTGMEHLVDDLKVSPSEVLLWRADELVFNSNKLVDQSIGSFKCSHNLKEVGIYRFDKFAHVVNTLVYLNEDLEPHTLNDFVNLYSKKDDVSVLSDFGEYKEWQTKETYYELQSELIQNDEHSSIFVEIDLGRDTITKTNRYADEPYSFNVMEKSREVQYSLWSEANFLELANAEQSIFLPKFLERSVNKRGNYCDTITEQFIYGSTLDSLLLNGKLPKTTWKYLLEKIVEVQREVFHNDSLEDSDELYHSYISKKKRENYFSEYESKLSSTLYLLTEKFTKENEQYNYFVLSNNDIAEWKMFFELFLKEHERQLTKDNLIYNGSCERLVHNNLFFENIVYDTFSNKIFFINPRSREHDFVEKYKDFARLYLSAYCGMDALLCGKYSEERGIISLSEQVLESMSSCEDILDELFENNLYLKHYAIVMMLELATSDKLSTEQQVVLLRYASQLKKTWLF